MELKERLKYKFISPLFGIWMDEAAHHTLSSVKVLDGWMITIVGIAITTTTKTWSKT